MIRKSFEIPSPKLTQNSTRGPEAYYCPDAQEPISVVPSFWWWLLEPCNAPTCLNIRMESAFLHGAIYTLMTCGNLIGKEKAD